MKRTRHHITLLAVLAAGAVLSIAGCSDDSNPSSSGGGNTRPHFKQVSIQGSSFNPATLNLVVGDTVLWTNKDGINHTVTSDTGSELNSGTLTTNQTYQHVFTTSGTFGYHCTVHPSMAGTVNVP